MKPKVSWSCKTGLFFDFPDWLLISRLLDGPIAQYLTYTPLFFNCICTERFYDDYIFQLVGCSALSNSYVLNEFHAWISNFIACFDLKWKITTKLSFICKLNNFEITFTIAMCFFFTLTNIRATSMEDYKVWTKQTLIDNLQPEQKWSNKTRAKRCF